jgi:signal transduction histidine kinase
VSFFLSEIKAAFLNKFHNKIIFAACISMLVFLVVIMVLAYFSLYHLFDDSSNDMQNEMTKLNYDFVAEYMNQTSNIIDIKLQEYKDDEAIIADLLQKYIDNEKQFRPLTATMKTIPYFRNKLRFEGRYYENTPDKPNVLLVQRRFLDKNNNIRPEVQREIDRSMILDYLMPSVYKYGSPKLWLYFEGSTKASFMRSTPWNDMGKTICDIYPKFPDVDIWSAFNPGLVEAWERDMKNHPQYKQDLSRFTIIKPPTQDGGSGKMIMTLDTPVWSKDRRTFQGAMIIDVSLDEIVAMINHVKLAQTGFAYICQSDGNILALNHAGEKILGLKNAAESSVKGKTGASYNRMLRFFKDSKFPEVRQIRQPEGAGLVQSEIRIGGRDYMIFQKKLKPQKEWVSGGKNFVNESWTLGFVIPSDELYASYYSVRKQVGATTQHILFQQVCAFLVIMLLLLAFIAYSVRKNVRPLGIITGYAAEVAGGDFNKNLPIEYLQQKDELGDLSRAIQVITEAFRKENVTLEEKIQEKNRELEEQYKYIIETEKIASLGNLVAGVAHEINTPLGNGIATLSYVQMLNLENRKRLAEGIMSKKDLQEFMAELHDSLEIMELNLGRAATLIKSFKKIAVDQTSENRVLFNLRENAEAVILSLRHEYKNTRYKIINDCPEELNIKSYPGAFSQIFTNFIMNSLTHGFRGKEEGSMQIGAIMGVHMLKVIYSDNGVGISEENMERMYEPFYTTNRQGGSSGLGLHIVHNIVSQQLKGTIRCESFPDNGVRYIIDIPRKSLE